MNVQKPFKHLFILILLAGVLFGGSLSATQAQEGHPATVIAPSAWVYAGPSSQTALVELINHGQWIRMLARSYDSAWINIKLDDGRTGWVSASVLQPGGDYPIAHLPVHSGAPGDSGDGPGSVAPVGVIAWDFVPLHSHPDCVGYLGDLRLGETVNLIGRSANSAWLQVQTADGRVGWVNARLITTHYPIAELPITDGSDPQSIGPAVVIITDRLNVRFGPGLGYGVVTSYNYGQRLAITGYRSADYIWIQVRLPNGRIGWVNTCCVLPEGFSIARLKELCCSPFIPQTHVVQEGETLNDIAARYGVDILALAALNNLVNLPIYPGLVLTIP